MSVSALALALGALPFGAAQAGSDDSRPDTPSLAKPMNGQAAVDALGAALDEAAALNGMTAGHLRHLLTTDSTAWVDGNGRVYFVEPPAPAGAAGPANPEGVAPYALDQTFLLHSKPGSNRTIMLDFDGAVVSGTYWNEEENVPNGTYPAWTLDGDAATFNAAEREAIQKIWQQVSEDYAPFDVDVTTEEPGLAKIQRVDTADQVYGTRALITPSTIAEGAICGTPTPSCGGVAYIDVFGLEDPDGTKTQPAWVFPQSLSNDYKNIAEAATHEVGHNFSLEHDGLTVGTNQGAPCPTTNLAYYCGHAMWAPIMGAGYYRPVTQWSKGEYLTANNVLQDDVALIAARAPYRADEGGGTVGTAAANNAGTHYITTAADVDALAMHNCTGNITINAASALTSQPSPNLDIQLELLNAGGTVLQTNNPASAMVNDETASGMSASVTDTLAAGNYFVRVDGVGNGTGATGYTDYGSIGAYSFTSSGSGTCTPEAPVAVKPVGNGAARSVAVTWTPAGNIGGTAASYTVFVNGQPKATTTSPSATLTGLPLGTALSITVSATNASGTSPASQVASVTLTAKPGAPSITKAKSGKPGGKKTAKFSWSAPTDNGGLAITGYTVQILKKGKVVKTVQVAAGKTSYKFKTKKGGKYKAVVTALNSLGAGTPSAPSKAVKAK